MVGWLSGNASVSSLGAQTPLPATNGSALQRSGSGVSHAFGSPLLRVEDEHLVTGRGCYASDHRLEGQVYMSVVRSSLASARILSVDASSALQRPGVLAVYTAADLPPGHNVIREVAGPPELLDFGRPILAEGRVRYAGEAVAVVVAETRYLADDAAMDVYLDLDPLPAVTGVDRAVASGAPTVQERFPGNVGLSGVTEFGDVEAAFAAAATVVSQDLFTHRVCGAAIEPRAATASPEGAGVRIWTSTQHVFGVRDKAAQFLSLDPTEVIVQAPDVGGGFGPKGRVYPEEMLTALMAVRLQRPVQWVASRGEDTSSTVQAHGSRIKIALAADGGGHLLGLKATIHHDLGAYVSIGAGIIENLIAHLLSGYVLPAMRVDYHLCFTNAVPTGTIRGGGRPQGNFAIERMMDRLAFQLHLEPDELRRRNLIQPSQMPYDTGHRLRGLPTVYDSGDYPRLLQMATDLAAPEIAQAKAKTAGKLVGVGLAFAVEGTGIGVSEPARIEIASDGVARVYIGSSPGGQGHLTMASQIVAARLGWPAERIAVVAGDSSALPAGGITAASRTAVHVGNATSLVARATRTELLRLASDKLEVDVADLELADGVIGVNGAPARSIPAADLVPEGGLKVSRTFSTDSPTVYASSCHIAVVGVDPMTGMVSVLAYAIAHDLGHEINARIVEGQLHGGLLHGLGFALLEEAVYAEDGTFMSPTFLDYSIATAPDFPFTPVHAGFESVSQANPEGIKGAGEGATIPSPAAIANAVEDALRQVRPDVVVTEIPITPLRVRRLISG